MSSYEFNLQRKFCLVPDEHEQESFENVKLKDCNQRQELEGSAAHIDTNYLYYSSDSSISQELFWQLDRLPVGKLMVDKLLGVVRSWLARDGRKEMAVMDTLTLSQEEGGLWGNSGVFLP